MHLFRTFRQRFDESPLASDTALAVLTAVFALASSALDTSTASIRPIDLLGLFLLLVPSLAVIFRRNMPMRALTVATGCGFSYWIADYPGGGAYAAMLVLLYSAAIYIENRKAATLTIISFTIAVFIVLLVGYFHVGEEEVTLSLILVNMVGFQLAWLVGDSVRNRRNKIIKLEQEMMTAQTLQEARTNQAIAQERTRIARELHDIVAHSLSVVIVQAQAAQRVLGKDEEAVIEALEAIEHTGRSSMADIRSVVGYLRDNASYDVELLDDLYQSFEKAGLKIKVQILGEKVEGPPLVNKTAYRIVQEALTNVMKHGGPNAKATVRFTYTSDSLTIRVEDTGRGLAANKVPPGYGLLGMKERAEALGGSLATGPRAGGGFFVKASLPLSFSP